MRQHTETTTTLDKQRIRLDWIKTLGKKPTLVNDMGAAVAGEPWHNNANGEHRKEDEATAMLTNTYAAMNGEGDGRRRTTDGGEVWVHSGDDFPAMSGGNGGVDGLLLGAANPMEATATMDDDERRGWRPNRGNNALVHGDGTFRRDLAEGTAQE
jgi:hypothetical protein